MAKDKGVFFCKECGYESAKWMGQCPACKEWNSFAEEKIIVNNHSKGAGANRFERIEATSITAVQYEYEERIKTNITELDRVLGGGIVAGSLVLVGGDPGIGKSTLLLQMCRNLIDSKIKILYVSGEESLSQIKMRGERLGAYDDNLMLLCDNDIDNVEYATKKCEAKVLIVDSIQTMIVNELSQAPGTLTQVREVTSRLMQMAKKLGIAIFIVGHVTKEGTVAGPKTLEHMVDSVLYFEGDGNEGFRVLRAVKNRFGSTNEIGVFNMTQKGLEEVNNPSQMLLNGRPVGVSGSVVVASMEGSRSILVELQALVCNSSFNMPRRTAVGLDYNRVNLLMAVLEKRAGFNLAGYDAYVNIAGGMKISDPSVDLGIVCAIASSFRNKAIEENVMIIGEIGLAGEIRGVTNVSQRVKEAAKMGFTKCIIPKSNVNKEIIELEKENNIKVIGVSNISEALSVLMY